MRPLSCFLAIAAHFAGAVPAADDVPVQAPVIQPASREAELALAGIKVPEGIKVQLFAAEPMLANPVAFWVR